ncbi:MAG: hypothetical protein SWY16_08540 [Cyanobacteriota bacterium]|nr:hypothetical protein [Cyanobacteriota bacterium]
MNSTQASSVAAKTNPIGIGQQCQDRLLQYRSNPPRPISIGRVKRAS